MKRIVPILLASLAGCASPRERGYDAGAQWSSCVPVETFRLIDTAGKTIGPFPLTNGAPVAIASQTFLLQRVERGVERIENHMKQCRLPEIDFRDARLDDVLEFLESGTVPFGPEDEVTPEIEFVLLGRGIARLRTTLELRNTTVYDVFTLVCDMHGLTYQIDNRGVVFVMPKPGKHVTQDDEP